MLRRLYSNECTCVNVPLRVTLDQMIAISRSRLHATQLRAEACAARPWQFEAIRQFSQACRQVLLKDVGVLR
jgi:hypothetical protein